MEPEGEAWAALLTPPAPAGIAVIALHGPAAGRLLAASFRSARGLRRALPPPGRAAHGFLFRGTEPLDEVLLVCTGTGRFEICCHGGSAPAEAVLRSLSEAGARSVPWSALLPPRTLEYDVTRALLSAAGTVQAAVLAHQASGVLRRALRFLVRAVEARGARPDRSERIARARRLALRLESSYDTGRFLARPPRVVLRGEANVGKSTLFNAILGESRALTSRIPGTTRDPVEALFLLEGIPLRLFDLPGERVQHGRDTSTGTGERHAGLQSAAHATAERCLADADLVVEVRDLSREDPPSFAGGRYTSCLTHTSKKGTEGTEGRGCFEVLRVWNKADLRRGDLLESVTSREDPRRREIFLSALHHEGIPLLLDAMAHALGLGALGRPAGPILFNRRQRALVRGIRRGLEKGARPPRSFASRLGAYITETFFLP